MLNQQQPQFNGLRVAIADFGLARVFDGLMLMTVHPDVGTLACVCVLTNC
jgi:hypothetical protein